MITSVWLTSISAPDPDFLLLKYHKKASPAVTVGWQLRVQEQFIYMSELQFYDTKYLM